MKIESSFVLLYLVCGDIPLAAHEPDGRQHVDIERDLRMLGELPMFVLDMLIYHLDCQKM